MPAKSRERVNRYSLKFNIWFFVCIILLALICLILSAFFFITNFFYNGIMKADLINELDTVIVNCQKNYSTAIGLANLPSDVNAAIFDRAGHSLSETSDFYKEQFFSENRSTIMKSDELFFDTIFQDNCQLMICGKRVKLSDGNIGCVYLSVRIYENNMQSQVFAVTLVVLLSVLFVSAIIASFFMAKYITQPITRIYDKVKQLTKGDYNVKFDSSGYTEIDKLASTLTMTAQQLKETDTLKTELIANVSHDLKTPLTLIKSYAEMIRDLSGDNKEKRTEHLNVIIDETDRLTALVNDLVKLSKLQAQTQEMEYSEFNLSDMIRRVLKNFEVLETYTFETEIEDGIVVLADEKRISQVLSNLIGNAVNYTGDDKYVKVTLRVIGNKRVRVDVFDHGVGIPSDELEKIWDRYYRSNKTHKREVSGSGLGLSIVKNILMAHNAEYGVNSIPNEGSDFYFILEL